MEYQVEDISPIEKKIEVSVPANEVNAALDKVVARYKGSVRVDGFRKGRVPSSIIENRYRHQIYEEATNDLVNEQVKQVLGDLHLQLLSELDIDFQEVVRDQDFSYSLGFQHVPDIELPEYKGLKGTKEAVQAKEEDIQSVLDRVRTNMAGLVDVDEDRAPTNGEIAIIDFSASRDGRELQGGQAENFELTLGESQSLEALEELVKTLTPGQSTDQEITFPSDFLNQGLSEVSVDMHVQLKGIKTRVLPEVDDDLAQRAGGFKDVKEMRQAIRDSYEKGREQVARSETQRQLLDELLAKVDFPLPESMVENQIQGQVQKTRRQLESQGQSLESAGKSEADIRKASRPEAENTVKSYLFLLAIAHKEGVTVSGQDLERHLHRLAGETGQDVESLKEYYKKNDLIHALIDQLRADKAMDLIYEHAQIEEVTPGQDPKDLDQAQPAADSGQ